MPSNDLFELAAQYRAGLRQMFDVVRAATGGCQCNLRDEWSQLMDSGVPKRSPDLTIDGITCLACLVEAVYEESIGSDVFDAEMISEIKMRLGDHSVIAALEDENGKLHYRIVERPAIDPLFDEEDPSTD
jgi:hypothetical protein